MDQKAKRLSVGIFTIISRNSIIFEWLKCHQHRNYMYQNKMSELRMLVCVRVCVLFFFLNPHANVLNPMRMRAKWELSPNRARICLFTCDGDTQKKNSYCCVTWLMRQLLSSRRQATTAIFKWTARMQTNVYIKKNEIVLRNSKIWTQFHSM